MDDDHVGGSGFRLFLRELGVADLIPYRDYLESDSSELPDAKTGGRNITSYSRTLRKEDEVMPEWFMQSIEEREKIMIAENDRIAKVKQEFYERHYRRLYGRETQPSEHLKKLW